MHREDVAGFEFDGFLRIELFERHLGGRAAQQALHHRARGDLHNACYQTTLVGLSHRQFEPHFGHRDSRIREARVVLVNWTTPPNK
jgi:hypothetical protein